MGINIRYHLLKHYFLVCPWSYTVEQAGSICIKNQKLKKIQFVVKSFHPKNNLEIFLNQFLHKRLADLHGFANLCKLPVSHTFKVVQFKIYQKVVLLKYLKFSFELCKKFSFQMCYQVCKLFIFSNCAKMQKVLKAVQF